VVFDSRRGPPPFTIDEDTLLLGEIPSALFSFSNLSSFFECFLHLQHSFSSPSLHIFCVCAQALLADLEDLRRAGTGRLGSVASDVSASGAGRLAPEALAAYFDLIDANRDGAISQDEFMAFACRTGLRNFLD